LLPETLFLNDVEKCLFMIIAASTGSYKGKVTSTATKLGWWPWWSLAGNRFLLNNGKQYTCQIVAITSLLLGNCFEKNRREERELRIKIICKVEHLKTRQKKHSKLTFFLWKHCCNTVIGRIGFLSSFLKDCAKEWEEKEYFWMSYSLFSRQKMTAKKCKTWQSNVPSIKTNVWRLQTINWKPSLVLDKGMQTKRKWKKFFSELLLLW